MEYKTIKVEVGKVSKITLNRPDRRNSFSFEMLDELEDALYMLDADDRCGVIVLQGEGKGFCAGGDMGDVDAKVSVAKMRVDSRRLPKFLTALTKIGKVTIAKVHGFAMAGGLGIATTCDLTVVADNAKLGTSEIQRGLFPFIISANFMRCMPQKKMMEILFTGDRITPAQAVEYGLANYAVPAEDLDRVVDELANKIASYSPAAIRMGKEAVYTARDMEFYKAMDYLAECINTIKLTDDAKEGIHAFFEKRDPVWTGN